MKVRILAFLEKDDVEHIDKLIKDEEYATRAHYIRRAVKHFRESNDE
jgi:Arc/MetJ-type ribon-helix-helix transcriptional regulator